ncbi:isoaspartyl peptidase/L-asparaginase [Candidatus Methylomirabilis sp.]|uniref:isoaspartyl peptidase/L-asparaginase family protein n=1 Tax=Candidatus Methylomirabilis sp. TaxID=2032687 RepID=UPI002A5F8C24|nr:isoaspartyl peptidase/L-asparaginase [Candidatus Methylomirabilis sp.]
MSARSFGPVILVHGGAGKVAPDLVEVRRAGIRAAAEKGWQTLTAGGSAVEAVEQAVKILEDDPAFNAGRGACLNRDGEIELDASIMDGRDLAAGAIGAVKRIANPVTLARAVMGAGGPILLVGDGARQFAATVGITECVAEALLTERQRTRWAILREEDAENVGTVGAVALDQAGHLAAATSTGGLPLKAPGRVGDSALIGCGTYADDQLGAASCTGNGEAIIKLVLAKTAVEFLRMGEEPMEAARRAVRELTARTGAEVGIILLDSYGRIGVARNTAQMACACILEGNTEPEIFD